MNSIIKLPKSDTVTPALADAMRKPLCVFRTTQEWSFNLLSCDITEMTGVKIDEEALRRYLNGTQMLQQAKLRAIREYLEEHNTETAQRAALTTLAIAVAAGFKKETAPDGPKDWQFAGLYRASGGGWDSAELELDAVGHGGFIATERLRAGSHLETAQGYGALSSHGTLNLRMSSGRGYTFEYQHFGSSPELWEGKSVRYLKMGRVGAPMELSGDSAADMQALSEFLAENIFLYVRVPDIEDGAAQAPLPPVPLRVEACARQAAMGYRSEYSPTN